MSKEELKNLWGEFGPKISKKAVILSTMIMAIIIGIVFYREFQKLPDGHLKFVACNVGQGDALYFKTPQGLDILVDGGPDEKVLRCLSNNMPFWDRKIELVFQTHSHADHATGLIAVKNRYQIGHFFDNLVDGDKITTGDHVTIEVLGPSFRSGDANNDSIILKINKILLMGDAPLIAIDDIDILKVGHHGSRTSLDEEILKQLNPKTAVISAGKDNSFGHPAPETISLLEKLGIKIRRTDLEGEIVLAP